MASWNIQFGERFPGRILGFVALFCLAWVTSPVRAQQPTASPRQITTAKQAVKKDTKPARSASNSRPAAQTGRKGLRRDPFRSLQQEREQQQSAKVLPPGKRGLVISQISVDGIVIRSTGAIAVVTMPGRNRAFFLRVRDRLYDGVVTRILGDRVVFHERTKDVFGRTVERDVVKVLSSAAKGSTTP